MLSLTPHLKSFEAFPLNVLSCSSNTITNGCNKATLVKTVQNIVVSSIKLSYPSLI